MRNVWKLAAALASLALAACGGGGGNAAVSKTFNYGAAQTPTSAEQTAIASAASGVSDTSTFGSSPDATKATSIVSLADDLASSAMGTTSVAVGFTQDARLSHALRTAATIPDCTSVLISGTVVTVTFTNCQVSESGFTFTLNKGSITADSAKGTLSWSVDGSFVGTDATSGVSFNLGINQSGSLTVTSTTIKGSATSSMWGTVSLSGQGFSFKVDTAVAPDITYSADCVLSGTIEVKRVWAQRPTGATAVDLPDAGVKLVWTVSGSCGQAMVQHSI